MLPLMRVVFLIRQLINWRRKALVCNFSNFVFLLLRLEFCCLTFGQAASTCCLALKVNFEPWFDIKSLALGSQSFESCSSYEDMRSAKSMTLRINCLFPSQAKFHNLQIISQFFCQKKAKFSQFKRYRTHSQFPEKNRWRNKRCPQRSAVFTRL